MGNMGNPFLIAHIAHIAHDPGTRRRQVARVTRDIF
jgi:hypothetical protein